MKKLLIGLLALGSISTYASNEITLLDTIINQRDFNLVSVVGKNESACPDKVSFTKEDSGRVALNGTDYSWLLGGLNVNKVNKGAFKKNKKDFEYQIVSKEKLTIDADKESIKLIEIDIAKDTVLDYLANTLSGYIRPYAQRTFSNEKRIVNYTQTESGFKVSGQVTDRVIGGNRGEKELVTCLYENI